MLIDNSNKFSATKSYLWFEIVVNCKITRTWTAKIAAGSHFARYNERYNVHVHSSNSVEC